jgi:hypothetical protein
MIPNSFCMVVCYGKDGAVLVFYFFPSFCVQNSPQFLNAKFITNPHAAEHVVVSLFSPLHLVMCDP